MRSLSRLATRARAAGLWRPFLADCRTAAWALPVAVAFFALVWIATP